MSTPHSTLLDHEDSGDSFISDLRARRRPRLFVISGPSGVGKDSIIEHRRVRFPEIHFAVTATTRARRPGEIDGVHYYFLDDETFAAREAQAEFLESAWVYQYRYGVPRTPVRHALARGQDVIVKVDVQGAASIRALAPDACFIFLAPESMTELFRRLKSRKTDDPEALMERFNAASRELLRAREFDYLVFNETEQLDGAIGQIESVILAERLRVDQAENAV
ncbi:MAG: guanylate kinase [Thermomicrobiales bacterium]